MRALLWGSRPGFPAGAMTGEQTGPWDEGSRVGHEEGHMSRRGLRLAAAMAVAISALGILGATPVAASSGYYCHEYRMNFSFSGGSGWVSGWPCTNNGGSTWVNIREVVPNITTSRTAWTGFTQDRVAGLLQYNFAGMYFATGNGGTSIHGYVYKRMSGSTGYAYASCDVLSCGMTYGSPYFTGVYRYFYPGTPA